MSGDGIRRRPLTEARIAVAIIAIILLWNAIAPMCAVLSVQTAQFSVDREEGFVFLQAMSLRDGHTIYGDITRSPFLVGNYPPLYQLAVAGTSFITGRDIATGRLVVLLSGIALAALLAWIVWKATGSLACNALAVGHLLTSYDFASWFPFARVDIPALALGLAGLAVGLRAKGRTGIITSALLCTAAFYTKQTALAAPAAMLAVLLWERRMRDAILFVAVSAGSALVILGVMLAATHGQYWLHTVTYNKNAWTAGQFWIWLRHLNWFEGWLLVAVALAAVFALIERQRGGEAHSGEPVRVRARRIAAIYLALSTFWLLATGKAGAAQNYLIEFQVALSMFIAIELGIGLAGGVARRRDFLTLAILIAFGLHFGAPFLKGRWQIIARNAVPLMGEYEKSFPQTEAVLAARARGTAMSEDPIIGWRAGSEPTFQPFIMSQLAKEGKWDPAPFIKELNERKFGAIVTVQELESAPVLMGFAKPIRDAVLANYQAAGAETVGGHTRFLYMPKAPEAKR